MRERVRSDVAVNLVMSLLVAGAMLLMIRRAGASFAPVFLGLWLLSRRVADSFSNLVQLGLPYALRRFVAVESDMAIRGAYAAISLAVVAGVALIGLGIGLVGGGAVGRLLFPTGGSTGLVEGTILAMIALALNNLALSLLVAQRHFAWGNLLNLLNTSGWPIIVMTAWRPPDLTVTSLIVVSSGLSVVFSAAVLAAFALRNLRREDLQALRARLSLRPFFAFAFPRTFAPFAETLLLTGAAWLLRHNTAEAGYLLLAFTLLRIANVALQPVGAVAGVVIAQLGEDRGEDTIRRGLDLMVGVVIYAGVLLVATGYPWLHLILRAWLHDPALAGAAYRYAAVVFLALPTYLLYQGLKQVIDMVWLSPKNLYTSFISVAILFGTWLVLPWMGVGDDRVVLAAFAGIFTTGVCTLYWLWPSLGPSHHFGLVRLTLVGAVILAANLAVARATADSGLVLGLAAAGATAALTAAGAVAALVLYRPAQFVRDITRFALPQALHLRLSRVWGATVG